MNPILLAADPGASGQLTSFLVLIVPMIAIWYFLVLGPQSKQRKKVQEMLTSLKSGDRVVTSGGIYGTIVGFKNGTVQLQIAPQVKIDVSRSAITGVVTEEESSGKQEPEAKGKKK